MPSKSKRRWLIILAILILASLLLAPTPGRRLSAQIVGLTPTYQASFSQYDNLLPGSEFRAFGVMLGIEDTGAWWTPHLWIQRYRSEVYQFGPNPSQDQVAVTGWLVSVGPAIEFLENDRWIGAVLPEMILGAPGGRNVDSGVGVHLGFRGGFFIPQLFSRVQTHGRGWFWTVGVGMTMDVVWDPDWSGGSPWG